jgi:hypothetical protein
MVYLSNNKCNNTKMYVVQYEKHHHVIQSRLGIAGAPFCRYDGLQDDRI